MRPSIRSAIIALTLAAWLSVDCGTGQAEKGRGGGGGGGRGHASGANTTTDRAKAGAARGHSSGPQGHASAGSSRDSDRPKHVVEHKQLQPTDPIASDRRAPDGSHPWSMQRANEERKLNHRLGVADKLERLADANGNEQLRSTAERMRQKAHEHYAKRLAKIDSKLPANGQSDALPDELADGRRPLPELPSKTADSKFVDSSPAAPLADQKLTGRQNAVHRQMLNEERKLAHQTDLAERLRAIAEEQGDPALLEKADRIEQEALDRFANRMEAIHSFQERHGLAVDDSQ